MDFRHMHYFRTVAETKSISAAARLLHISQPPLSRQISDLERELGVLLFHRTKNGLELTDAGKLLYERSIEMREIYDETLADLSRLANEDSCLIRIGSVDYSHTFLEPYVKKLLKKCLPKAAFYSEVGTASDILEKLNGGTVDFALLRYPFAHADDYDTLRLTKEKWTAMMLKTHPLASEILTVEKLRNEKLILPSRESLYVPLLREIGLDAGSDNILCYYFDMVNSRHLAVSMGATVIVPDILQNSVTDENLIFKEIAGLKSDTFYTAVKKRDSGKNELINRCWKALKNFKPEF